MKRQARRQADGQVSGATNKIYSLEMIQQKEIYRITFFNGKMNADWCSLCGRSKSLANLVVSSRVSGHQKGDKHYMKLCEKVRTRA